MLRLSRALPAIALVGAVAATSAGAAQRTFVASYGSDANTVTNCGFANPCRGFGAAMTVTDEGGEVVALDAAGYGTAAITKSITLTANPGFFAGIAASSGAAITIATAAIHVTLRGLNLNGIGAENGVLMSNGARLSIENCIVSNFLEDGVRVNSGATVRIVDSLLRDNNASGVRIQGGADLTVSGTKLLGNGYAGVFVYGGTATTTAAAISDSVASGNVVAFSAYGEFAGSINLLSVSRSTASNNAYGIIGEGPGTQVVTASNNLVTRNSNYGFFQSGTFTTFESLGNNTVRQNGTNSGGTITIVSGS